MKTVYVLFAILFAFNVNSLPAQSSKESLHDRFKSEAFKVNGVCGMCEHRIEKIALTTDGVQSASWNEDMKVLVVRYNFMNKNVIEVLQKKIANAGHDTEKYKATDIAYEKLPDCCHYPRKQ